MKKLVMSLLMLCLGLVSIISFGQDINAIPAPTLPSCSPRNSLSINTGINSSGGLVAIGTTDPFWATATTIASPATNWNAITGTRILSPNATNSQKGTFKFTRKFFVCKESNVSISGNFRCDNVPTSFKLFKNGSSTPVHTFGLGTPTDPSCWAPIPFSMPTQLLNGEYYLEFEYRNDGSYGGFALSGVITSNQVSLANYKNCCCPCNLLPNSIPIEGPKAFCKKPCKSKLTYSASVPPAIKNCVSYTWSISPTLPFTGQGTGQIQVDCKDLKLNTNYTIVLITRCGEKAIKSVTNLNVCQADPSFTISTSGSSLLASSGPGTHSFQLVKDTNNNCNIDNGENVSVQNGNSVTFTGIQANQQYVLYHYISTSCELGIKCSAVKKICFKWLTSANKSSTGSEYTTQISEESIIDDEADMPPSLLKNIQD